MQEFNIVAFVSSQKEAIRLDFPRAKIYDSVEELSKDSEIEMVVLCSPTFLHYEQAKILLEANKHLVIEKPFTVSALEAEDLIRIAKKNNLRLSVYHNRRWDSPFLTLQKLISENVLGDIYHYAVHYDRWRPNVQDRWREKEIAGAGILYDLGSHVIDQVLCLFGKPEKIISDLDCQRSDAGAIDYFHLIFKYKKMRAVLHASSLVQAPREHLVLHGSKATFVHQCMDPQEAELMNGKTFDNMKKQESAQLLFQEAGSILSKTITTVPGSYESFYIQMAQAIRLDKQVPVDPSDVVGNIQIIENISQSTLNSDLSGAAPTFLVK